MMNRPPHSAVKAVLLIANGNVVPPAIFYKEDACPFEAVLRPRRWGNVTLCGLHGRRATRGSLKGTGVSFCRLGRRRPGW
jgi:hypothetical protein